MKSPVRAAGRDRIVGAYDSLGAVMTLSISISGDAERRLHDIAREAGVSAEVLASKLLERTLSELPDLSEISGSAGERFRASGMSEDDLARLLEEEKHAMRAARRAKAS